MALLEAPEQARLLRAIQSRPGVVHDDAHATWRIDHGFDPHPDFAMLGEPDRVAEQVEQYLLDPERITDQHDWHVGVDAANKAQAAPSGHRCLQFGNLAQQRPQLERMVVEWQAARFDPRQGQRIVDQLQQVMARVVDRFDLPSLAWIKRTVQQ